MTQIADLALTGTWAFAALRPMAGAVAGLCLGLVHFELLHRDTDLLLRGRLLAGLALLLLRFALVAGVLAGLAWLGPAMLLGAGLGLPLGRARVLKRHRGAR